MFLVGVTNTITSVGTNNTISIFGVFVLFFVNLCGPLIGCVNSSGS